MTMTYKEYVAKSLKVQMEKFERITDPKRKSVARHNLWIHRNAYRNGIPDDPHNSLGRRSDGITR